MLDMCCRRFEAWYLERFEEDASVGDERVVTADRPDEAELKAHRRGNVTGASFSPSRRTALRRGRLKGRDGGRPSSRITGGAGRAFSWTRGSGTGRGVSGAQYAPCCLRISSLVSPDGRRRGASGGRASDGCSERWKKLLLGWGWGRVPGQAATRQALRAVMWDAQQAKAME